MVHQVILGLTALKSITQTKFFQLITINAKSAKVKLNNKNERGDVKSEIKYLYYNLFELSRFSFYSGL